MHVLFNRLARPTTAPLLPFLDLIHRSIKIIKMKFEFEFHLITFDESKIFKKTTPFFSPKSVKKCHFFKLLCYLLLELKVFGFYQKGQKVQFLFICSKAYFSIFL